MKYYILFAFLLLFGISLIVIEFWLICFKRGRAKLARTYRNIVKKREYHELILFLFIPLLSVGLLYASYRYFPSINTLINADRTRDTWVQQFSCSWIDSFAEKIPAPQSFNVESLQESNVERTLKLPLIVLLQNDGWELHWNHGLYSNDYLAQNEAEVQTVICVYSWETYEKTGFYRVVPGNVVYRNNIHALAVAVDVFSNATIPLKYWTEYWIDEPYKIAEIGKKKAARKRLMSTIKVEIDKLVKQCIAK